MLYKNTKLGNWLHYNHPGAEAISAGFEQIQVGEEKDGSPIYDVGAELFAIRGWQDAWGAQPTDEDLGKWTEPDPEPMPVNIGKIFADAYAAAPLALNQLKQAVWTARVMAGTDPAQATAEGVALVLRFGPELGAYKDAGGHTIAAQALYAAISSPESVAALPWLTEPILAIFAAALAPAP